MKIEYKGNFTSAMKLYTKEKLSKLKNKGINIEKISVKLDIIPPKTKLEISVNNSIRKTVVSDKDFYSLICDVIDNIAVQMERYKEYSVRKNAGVVFNDDDDYKVSREKLLIVPKTSQYEAIENMEALGHSFFIYRDIDLCDDIVVLYKRLDGTYGSIQCK